ncbi:MAG: glycosyltransferase family 39 protein, partial [Anaerolineae bacterium]|nr:glycosyltransferase family 39 protein [Anaerolineae bacterium]
LSIMATTVSQKFKRNGIAIIVGAFISLAFLYAWVNPILESPDAIWHFEYILHLAQGKGFPRYSGSPLPMQQEASQPPLYYILAAPLVSIISIEDKSEVIAHNPHAAVGLPLHPYGNKNVLAHCPDERFSFYGTVLAVRLAALLSISLGAITVYFSYRAARLLFGKESPLALLSAAFVAFNPQFIFLSASLNNDNLVTALATILFYLTLFFFDRPPSRSQLFLAGVLFGLIAIAKLNGLVVIFPLLISLAMTALRSHRFRDFVYWAFIAGGVAFIIGGWWYIRNLLIYGDPTGLKVMFAMFPPRERPPNWQEILYNFEGVRKSYWAVFGWFNIVVHPWIYSALDWWMLIGIVGFILFLAMVLPENGEKKLFLWLLTFFWALMYLLALVFWTYKSYPQGRMLFPALAAFSAIWVSGWNSILPERWGKRVIILSAFALAALAIYALWGYIWPSYNSPPLLEESEVPASLHRLNWTFADSIRLIGIEIWPQTVKPGQTLNVRACWQVLKPVPRNYSVFVHVWGKGGIIPGGKTLTQVDTFPGLGNSPFRCIPPGKVVCDVYPLLIPQDAEAPARLTIEVGAYDFYEPGHPGLKAIDEKGNHIPLGIAGYAALVPHQWPSIPPEVTPLNYRFHDGIKLVGFSLKGNTLKLYWTAEKKPSRDYTVFVHLVDEDGQWVAGFDGMPVSGEFPTSCWPEGALVEDERKLSTESLTS